MRLLAYDHPAFERHDSGKGHPERPARLAAARAGLLEADVDVDWRVAPRAGAEDLAAVHDPEYIESIHGFCVAGGGSLDADTRAGPHSWEAALRAAGAGIAAIDDLGNGKGDVGFAMVRPPGHHALAARAMGFCLFNNVAVAAARLRSQGRRVAIVDWDVHHGNGTQEMFYEEPDVLYISLHEFPFYPGTGWIEEAGSGPATGTVVNIPMPARACGDVYRAAMDRFVVPALQSFGPDWLLVSAGYDAHAADPLAFIRLQASDYGAMAAAIASSVPGGRLIFFLEGGYDLDAITASVAATVAGVAGREPGPPEGESPQAAWGMLELVDETVRRFGLIGNQ